jgi:DNA repair protein SbcC/Rad50
MKLEIKKISLLNFKGVRNYETNFSLRTTVYGDNSSGKTTIFDAFTYLLFGKDSLDRQQFEVKTLDKNNNVIWKV